MTLTEFLLARIADDEAACGPEDNSGYCDWLEGIHHTRARVLAECEAKRRIIAMYAEAVEQSALDGRLWGERTRLETVVKALAIPYANHPDYRDEWRP